MISDTVRTAHEFARAKGFTMYREPGIARDVWSMRDPKRFTAAAVAIDLGETDNLQVRLEDTAQKLLTLLDERGHA